MYKNEIQGHFFFKLNEQVVTLLFFLSFFIFCGTVFSVKALHIMAAILGTISWGVKRTEHNRTYFLVEIN